METNRASKLAKAFWIAEEKHSAESNADPLTVSPSNTAYHFDIERRRSFASGWIAGLNYMRRQRNSKR